MKKLIISALALMMAAVHGWAYDIIVCRTGDASAQTYESARVAAVAFADTGSVSLTLDDGSTVTVPADEFDSIRFDNVNGAVLTHAGAAESLLSVQGCVVSGPEGCLLRVYTTDGALCASATGSVSLSGLAAGVYVVTTEGQTIKVVIQ